jgi:hypothetical protein
MDKPITVTCPIHGDFQTLSEHHWQSKDGGCLSCQKDKHMLKYINNGNVFIEKSKLKGTYVLTIETLYEKATQKIIINK